MSVESTVKFINYPLLNKFDKGGIKFRYAALPENEEWKLLAVIYYSISGVEYKHGLRLDLGKAAFIDHLEEDLLDKICEQAAPEIADFLMEVSHKSLPPILEK